MVSIGGRSRFAKLSPPIIHRISNARHDLAITHEKIADVQVETGQNGGALPPFRKALEILESLRALDPLNANSTRAVAIEYEKLSDAYARAGDKAPAVPL